MKRTTCFVAAVALALVWATPDRRAAGRDAPKGPTIRLKRKDDADTKATFEVAGLAAAQLAALAKTKLEPDQWAALFAVRVYSGKPAEDKDRPAMLGSHRVEDGLLRFEPRFPLTRGVTYRAVFDPSRLPGGAGKGEPVVAEFTLPRPKPSAAAVVERIYPTRNKLPENQLKFYIHFSSPMRQGEVYKHIHLLNAAGKEVERVFLELDEELWDAAGKRFTLLFHPGRVKKGLQPREELGPILEEGKEYTLVIDRTWEDAEGNPLKESFRKTIKALAADDEAVEPKAWKIQAPAAGKAGPLTVAFPEPLDHALLHRLLWVTDAKGRRVEGTVQVTDEETRWHFTPEKPWQAGGYRLVADTNLEDLAANKIGQLFEVDVFRPIQRKIETKTVELSFDVK